ncbi:MAG: hypothetical protein PHT32_08780 [Candidatus Omnitrophica bacterium]|nr:hypothetical protein [Candidatus Omnitrophota bacterium]
MKFNFEATGIGSVPFKDARTACGVISKQFKSIPFWPQLPKRSFLENMYVQYAEKIPGLVMDEENKTVYIDTGAVAAAIEEVYGKYLDGDVEFFKISEDRAEGFYEFLESFKNPSGAGVSLIKGHITGPISYSLFLTDQNKKSAIYDKDLFELITKVLAMKAKWQIRKMKKVFARTAIFIDEPYLVSIGSSFVNINMEEAAKRLDEVVEAIKKEGALVGVHCCGNTDWPFLLKRGIDILSFDAYNFSKEFSLYAADINNFLAKGGTIAWGVVPAADTVEKETPKALASRVKTAIAGLVDKGISREAISSLVTPSCGVGTLDESTAKKVFKTVNELSEELRKI